MIISTDICSAPSSTLVCGLYKFPAKKLLHGLQTSKRRLSALESSTNSQTGAPKSVHGDIHRNIPIVLNSKNLGGSLYIHPIMWTKAPETRGSTGGDKTL
jgi:hypothetical protein